jgi:hypothetical protein
MRAKTLATIATIIVTMFLSGTGIANAENPGVFKAVTQQCE